MTRTPPRKAGSGSAPSSGCTRTRMAIGESSGCTRTRTAMRDGRGAWPSHRMGSDSRRRIPPTSPRTPSRVTSRSGTRRRAAWSRPGPCPTRSAASAAWRSRPTARPWPARSGGPMGSRRTGRSCSGMSTAGGHRGCCAAIGRGCWPWRSRPMARRWHPAAPIAPSSSGTWRRGADWPDRSGRDAGHHAGLLSRRSDAGDRRRGEPGPLGRARPAPPRTAGRRQVPGAVGRLRARRPDAGRRRAARPRHLRARRPDAGRRRAARPQQPRLDL